MTVRRSRALAGCLIAVTIAAGSLARAEDRAAVPLAIVGPDTLTTDDLQVELALMNARNSEDKETKLGEPATILRRMTQNQLLIQEGYRMGLDQEFAVRNPAAEVVHSECMKALLDSVTATVPESAPDAQEKRRQASQAYLRGLARTWGVSVDSTLLATLDYGSKDPAVQKRLHDSQEVLVHLSEGRKLTVADFTRELRFTEFHGLAGRADAKEKRDSILYEYVSRYVTGRQAKAQKLDRTPQMALLRQRFIRVGLLEEVLRVLTQIDFKPTDAEVSHYYREHVGEVTAPPRVKLNSLKVADKGLASELRDKALKGASVRWLAANDKRVAGGPAPFPESWLQPEQVGLKPEDLKIGNLPEPYQVPDGWVVAQIVEVEAGQPLPLEKCRDRILAMMQRDATRQEMIDSLARLEAQSPVVILPGAEAAVAKAVAELPKSPAAPVAPQSH
jgi:hypothetical protein